jgi:uncharacterized protein YbbC (DUF1343 family)
VRRQPVRTSVELIAEFHKEAPARFAWRQPPYEYEMTKEPIDILYGSDRLRQTVDSGDDVSALIASWSAEEERFGKQRERYLLY